MWVLCWIHPPLENSSPRTDTNMFSKVEDDNNAYFTKRRLVSLASLTEEIYGTELLRDTQNQPGVSPCRVDSPSWQQSGTGPQGLHGAGQCLWDGCCGGWWGLGAREEHCKVQLRQPLGLAKPWVPSGRWRAATHREQNKNYFPGVRGLSGMRRDCLTLNFSISGKNEINLISYMQWGWESELLGCSSRSSNIKVLICLLFLLIITFWSVQPLKHKACLY